MLATCDHNLPAVYRHVVTFRVAREEHHYLLRILAIGDKVTAFRGAAIILQDVAKFLLLDDAKTRLAGIVSYELKTPRTRLRLAVYLLLEENVDELARGSASYLRRRAMTPTGCCESSIRSSIAHDSKPAPRPLTD